MSHNRWKQLKSWQISHQDLQVGSRFVISILVVLNQNLQINKTVFQKLKKNFILGIATKDQNILVDNVPEPSTSDIEGLSKKLTNSPQKYLTLQF